MKRALNGKRKKAREGKCRQKGDWRGKEIMKHYEHPFPILSIYAYL